MRIVFLSRLFYPHIGGVEKHVLELSKQLIEKGHSIVVITEKYDSKLKDREIINGIEIYRVPVSKYIKIKKFYIWFWIIKNIHLFLDSDIVHAHDVYFWYIPLRIVLFNKLSFVTFHGYEGNKIPNKRAIIMYRLSEKLSDGNITIGKFYSKWFGIKPDFFSFGAVNKNNQKSFYSKIINNKKINIVYLGRLEEEAGIMQYLSILTNLKKKKILAILTILGDGSLKKRAYNYSVEHGLSVDFKGFVSDTNRYLEKSDIVFTSRYLGMLEALSMGKYTIAVYNNDIKKDYLIKSPFAKYVNIISNKNIDRIDEIIEYVNYPKKSSEILKEAYLWANSQTWDALCSQYLLLWSKKYKNN